MSVKTMTDNRSSILSRATSREQVDAPPINRNLSVDLAVVGGGFTGCAAALEAAKRGASVWVLEAETVGYGGPGRNVGLVNAGLWLPPDTIVARLGQDVGRRLIQILADAPHRVFSLVEREAIDCEATRKGTLHLAQSPAEVRDLHKRYHQGKLYAPPLKLLNRTETAHRTGTTAHHGSPFDARAGTIQPLSYCRGLAPAAKARGAAVHGNSRLLSIRCRNGIWVAEVNHHEVQAKSLLVTANAYQLGIAIPFMAQFASVSYCQFATEAMPATMRGDILASGEGCWDTAIVMSSFRIDGLGRMILGGIGSCEAPRASIHHTRARRKLRKRFPAVGDLEFERAWNGTIAVTADHVPKIVAYAYARFSYSGRGMGPGTVFGTEAAIALRERKPEEKHYSERFTRVKAEYYALGATLVHAVSRPLRSAAKR